MFGLSLLALLVPGIVFLTGASAPAAGTAWGFLPMALTLLLLLFTKDVYHAIDLATCVATRISEGGTSIASVEAQIAYVREVLV